MGGDQVHPVIAYITAAVLFGLGLYGVAVRRNMVLVLMAAELLLAGVNLVFVTADASLRSITHTGQAFSLFIIVIAAAEVGVGLAIALRLFRVSGTVDIDAVDAADSEVDTVAGSAVSSHADTAAATAPHEAAADE